MPEVKAGYCTLCRSRCGSLNEVEQGRLVAVRPNPRHPTGNALCAKGRAAPEMVGSPRRLTVPLRRTRPRHDPDPGFAPISWEEALGEIAARLGEIRARRGAEAVAFAVTTPSGTPMVDSFEWVERFIRVFGSPNLIYAVEICGWHKDYAQALTFGRGIGAPDYDRADVILLWGHNPARTWLAQATRIAAARRRGATVAVVDPKRSGSGEDADLWLRVRPGTDAALAMGAIRHLIETGRYDTAFVRRWTNAAFLIEAGTGRFVRARDLWPGAPDAACVVLGPDGPRVADTAGDEAVLLDQGSVTLRASDGRVLHCATALHRLRREASAYTPEHVARITGLGPEDLDRFYALFEGSPRLAYHSWTGVGQHTNATQTERAIATLYALTGANDRAGGNRWTVTPPSRSVNDYGLLAPGQRAKALGLDALPLGPPSRGWITARDFARAVLDQDPYRVEALMSFGANLVVSQGASSRNRDALRALDFHVHLDMFLNPTAENADIVLPASMPWEREALKIGFEITQEAAELVQLRQAMLPAFAESRADYAIVFDLACRLGHADAFFGGSVEAGWNHQLAPLGLTVADLRAEPEGIRVPQPCPERQYAAPRADGAPAGFATPTGRAELYSELLLEHGYPPLPSFVPPAGPADPSLPLWLSTAKSGWFVHSSHRHVASLRRKAPDPSVEISPAAAAIRGIREGDWIRLRTAHGTVRLRARLDPALADDVAIAEFGWWEDCPPLGRPRTPSEGPDTLNINDALSDESRDPVSGSVPLRAVACEITRDEARSRGWWSGGRAFTVTAARREAADVLALSLAPADGGPLAGFLPGQHVRVATEAGIARAYSLTGPHREPDRYEIAVRLVGAGTPASGRMSSHLHGLDPGATLLLETPHGTFTPPLRTDRPVILMAAGIGITPFVSYLEALADGPAGHGPRIRLLYVCRDGRAHPFGPRLRALAARNPDLAATHVFTRPAPGDGPGRDYDGVGRSFLFDLPSPFPGERPLAFLCGPESFVADATALLLAWGLPRFDISSELFTAQAEVPAELAPRSVTLARSGGSFRWSPDAGTLLDAAETAGLRLPSGCRTGQCESCQVRLAAGSVAHLTPYDGPPDHCLTCRAVPLADCVLDA
ncbi:molybdopterin-dependent oxidoreductase [Methylobacterium isbiliense]|uniref:Periplasmic nitrate reductase n=1 Tax=Methylobacterium isbiliense TaxID=315478 RepID=A0ABQ4SN10_9HYPH|nr:molybdopterin-dependent oxidoreductase [Methylobacterium isbiliense]MDN3623722.1 molybdopterin-dependent oxidoreductase [Methylobacterium isbiliense]GJE03823.1 Periplasmic nitrate reductase [Methylobacterium isbiliense]